jgi:uncharacterized membrane protein
MMRNSDVRRPTDLGLVMIFAAIGLMVTLLPGLPELLRAPLALPLVLALPGYALIAAMDPGRHAGGIERAVMTPALSIAITILGGLLLNLTPWGLRREMWALLLGGFSLAMAGVAVTRRKKIAANPDAPVAPSRPVLRLRPQQIALLGMAALLLIGAVVVARYGALNQPTEGFTQLWLQQVAGAAPGTVRLGVSNEEQQPVRYVLRMSAGERVLAEWDDIELQPGARWENTETLPADLGAGLPVEAALYREGEAEPYRRVHLWLPAAEPGQ